MGGSPPSAAPQSVPAIKQGLGNPAAINTLGQPGAKVYLWLRFTDPQGAKRDFPTGLQVRVSFNGGGTNRTETCQVENNGRLTFNLSGASGEAWQRFALLFPSTAPQFIVCEPGPGTSPPPGSPPTYPRLEANAPTGIERFFGLPADFGSPAGPWGTRHSDWTPGTGNAALVNASYSSGEFTYTGASPPQDLQDVNRADQPAELTLNPHWKFFRFVYFDRYYGPPAWAGAPVATGTRVSIPAVGLEGFRTQPAAPAGSTADTHSNWTIGADADHLVQCLPWILRRDQAFQPLPELTGAALGLRIRTPADTYVYSVSKTAREVRQIAPASPPASPPSSLAPSAERLKYYRLPALWKSRFYYTREVSGVSPPGGVFFHNLTAAQVTAADNAATPLVFSLDDLVLTDGNRAKLALGAAERVAVFHHRFGNRAPGPPTPAVAGAANLNDDGVYKPGADLDVTNQEGYPYTNVIVEDPQNPGTGGFYIHDYPDWTRLVVARGNLFDAFDERTPEAGNDVVGARAAVRWVDATAAPNGWGAGTDISAAARPARTSWPSDGLPYFSVQPFYWQQFLSRNYGPPGPVRHFEWSNAYDYPAPAPSPNHEVAQNGRFDVAHLRCCDHDGNDEIGCLFRYHRLSADTTSDWDSNNSQPVAAGTAGAVAQPCLTAGDQEDFGRSLVENVARRWNSRDTQNIASGWILPRPSSPAGANPAAHLRTKIVTFPQLIKAGVAHFSITCIDPNEGSSMSWWVGSGGLRQDAVIPDEGNAAGRGLAAAHEVGHAHGMPDDYLPEDTLNGAQLDTHPLYKCNHVPGNPYDLEDRSLMRYNWFIRARYYWYLAEWMRTLPGLGTAEFRIQHGTDEDDFELPHYQYTSTHPGRHYVTWPVSFNIRERSGTDTSCFDSYLYMMGADHFSKVVLPAILPAVSPPAQATVDGMLLVLLRLKFQLNIPGLTAADRGDFYKDVHDRFHAALNVPRKAARFQVLNGSPPAVPSFSRCFLHFRPCFLTSGATGANVRETACAPHLVIDIRPVVTSPHHDDQFTDNAPPAAKLLVLHRPNNWNTLPAAGPTSPPQDNQAWWWDFWKQKIFEACLRTLGLTHNASPAVPGSYTNVNSYIPIVRTVMNAAAPAPVVA